jgi:hypothetical protein
MRYVGSKNRADKGTGIGACVCVCGVEWSRVNVGTG